MRTTRNTAKEKILKAAWELFQEVGYDNATINDIIQRSGTSRGAFYHHFRAKEDLLFRMACFFDDDYKTWLSVQPDGNTAIEKLRNFLLYSTQAVENSEYRDFLSTLYGYEVMTEGHRYILDEDREYFKILKTLCCEGIKTGEISDYWSEYTLARTLAGLQRGLVYNWLLERCRYSLFNSATKVIDAFLNGIREKAE